ncbi:hypothetical protein CC1G_14515 [Coprinopsis cinerea okayama7|uniref:Uncharacterized protein n=1 Tax=Coprinopsis cinerea (strain Okayama-7 / 130 / ATCC MYA-4618 / FGSC 9003) TaxID=240176 RepID=D6RM55_COPC7|nr:hypothetical protein CC1G_14515 [Coprinopsis cinerea okayama7\|eukprot:XP_002911516.1 hypothetical protein CC1G_14515 [Coprinopsis cinerea okayama7\
MARPSKYATESERQEAKRLKNREYYQRNRHKILASRTSKKKDPDLLLAAGRPRKYHTKEEVQEAKRRASRQYYHRNRKGPIWVLSGRPEVPPLRDISRKSLPDWLAPQLVPQYRKLQDLQTKFRLMTSANRFQELRNISIQYLKSRRIQDIDSEVEKYNSMYNLAQEQEDIILSAEGSARGPLYVKAREMTAEIRGHVHLIEDMLSYALVGYSTFSRKYFREELDFQKEWRQQDPTAYVQSGPARTTEDSRTMTTPYPYGVVYNR